MRSPQANSSVNYQTWGRGQPRSSSYQLTHHATTEAWKNPAELPRTGPDKKSHPGNLQIHEPSKIYIYMYFSSIYSLYYAASPNKSKDAFFHISWLKNSSYRYTHTHVKSHMCKIIRCSTVDNSKRLVQRILVHPYKGIPHAAIKRTKEINKYWSYVQGGEKAKCTYMLHLYSHLCIKKREKVRICNCLYMHRLFLEGHKKWVSYQLLLAKRNQLAGQQNMKNNLHCKYFHIFWILYCMKISPLNFNLKGCYEHKGWR